MQTKLKDLWGKVKGFFAKLNKKIRILLGVCAAVILVVIIAAVILLNHKEYELLQGGLNASEISNLVQFLDTNGVTDYKVEGDKVYVPEGRAQSLQGQLALSGNLNSGFLYEYLDDRSGLTSTSSEQERNYLIASMQKLDAIIRTFEGVQDAHVTIAPGTDRVYVLDPNATPATASVTITPVSSKGISSNVAEAIRNVVRYSVQGLEIANVNVEDTYGNNYSDVASTSDSVDEASSMKLYYEEQTSNKVRSQVFEALEAIYGEDNVKVAVNTSIDINRRVVDSTTYHQPEGSVQGGGLIGRDQWTWEVIRDGSEPVGGTVGTATNSDIPYQVELNQNLTGDENYAGGSGDRDHKIDTTTEQTEILAFTISDVQVAVTINQNSPNSSALSVEALQSHVSTAAGLGAVDPENYVSVVIAPFAKDVPGTIQPGEVLPGVPEWAILAAIGGLILFIILLIIILILRGRAKKKRQAQQEALEEEMRTAQALAEAEAAAAAVVDAPPTGGADIMEVNTEKSMELRKTVRQFAQNNPEIAAQMVKAWLRGDDDNA